jgi:hypothetical protein
MAKHTATSDVPGTGLCCGAASILNEPSFFNTT